MDNPELLKTCTGCGQSLPATRQYFHCDRAQSSGFQPRCKTCKAQYHQANKEKTKEQKRKYRDSHKEQIAAFSREWLSRPEVRILRRINDHNRRSRKRQLAMGFSRADWDRAVRYWNGACAYCGKGPSLFDYNWTLHQDHYIPVARNGCYVPDNILPACQSCNLSKHDAEPVEWITRHFGKRKAKRIIARIETYFAWVKEQPHE